MKIVKANTVNEYIASFPPKTKKLLKQLRAVILSSAPKSMEGVGYGMPSYKLNGKQLLYFAGYEKHIGLYAMPTAHKKFEKQLSKYKQGKGSVQFPLDEPMPLKLITDIVKFRVTENNLKYLKKK